MGHNCVLCGKEPDFGGYSANVAGVRLYPVCSACERLCSGDGNQVMKLYPHLFGLGAPAQPSADASLGATPAAAPRTGSGIGARPNPALSRYADLYRAARLQTTIGAVVRVIGVIAAGGIVFVALLAGLGDSVRGLGLAEAVLLFGWIASGAFVGGVIFLMGVMISAQGQMLLAQADSAVHTSPFLTDEEKASAMALPYSASPDHLASHATLSPGVS